MAKHVVMTVSGTGVDMWNQGGCQPAAVAAELNASLCFWQPVGNYPAATVNMGTSVADGVNELVRLWNDVYPTGSKILLGYSQGGIVVSHFIRDELLSPKGRCYGKANQLVAVATWGNPCRLVDFASGNEFAGWPLPAKRDGVPTGGIAGPDCLTAADVAPHLATRVTHFWGEFVNTLGAGLDLYTENPDGTAAGSVETMIYNLIQRFNLTSVLGFVAVAEKLLTAEAMPEAIGIFEAILNGGLFAAQGSNAAHFTYDITPIVTFINLAASQTAPWS